MKKSNFKKIDIVYIILQIIIAILLLILTTIIAHEFFALINYKPVDEILSSY